MKKTIVFVDDESDLEFLLKYHLADIFKDNDIDFKCFLSGDETIEYLKSNALLDVALVVSDVNMPGINGFQLLDNLKILCPDAKVALMSAYSHEQYAKIAFERGAIEFFEKPLNFEKLKQFTSQHL